MKKVQQKPANTPTKKTQVRTPVRTTTNAMNKWVLIILPILFAVTYLVYTPSKENQFTNWDDDVYVTDNLYTQQLNKESVKVFFKEYFVSNYHPLTMISLGLNHNYAFLNPKPYINTNIILHCSNTLLVFIFVYFLMIGYEERNSNKLKPTLNYSIPIATITAVLFGLHTLHVESVSWISERKDVLYSFFFFLACFTYVQYLRKNKGIWLITTLVLFLCSILSKGMAVSFTVTMLAIDFLYRREWKEKSEGSNKILNIALIISSLIIGIVFLNMINSGLSSTKVSVLIAVCVALSIGLIFFPGNKISLEKIAFLNLSIIFGIIAVEAQKSTGALSDNIVFEFYERIGFASYGFTQYFIKLLTPHYLSGFYSYPDRPVSIIYYLAIVVPILFIFAFYKIWKTNRMLGFIMLFYIANIALVLQLIPVGNAIMADRYSYVPSLAFFLLIAWLVTTYGEKIKSLKIPLLLAVTVYCGYLGYLTYQRNDVWKTSLTFWDDVLSKYKNVPAAWNNRGNARKDANDFKGAIEDYNVCIQLKPDHNKAYNNRGIAKKNLGDIEGAVQDYKKSIEIKPDYDDAYSNLGNALRLLGKFDEAIQNYDKAISLKPRFAKAYSNRGATKIDVKDFEGAIQDLQYSLELSPRFVEAHYNLGNAYFNKASISESQNDSIKAREFLQKAVDKYEAALQLRPNYAEAYSNKAGAKYRMRDFNGAIADYSKALELKPEYIEALNNRAGTYYQIKNYQGAINDFRLAGKMQPQNPRSYYLKALCFKDLANKDSMCANYLIAAKLGLGQAANDYNQTCVK